MKGCLLYVVRRGNSGGGEFSRFGFGETNAVVYWRRVSGDGYVGEKSSECSWAVGLLVVLSVTWIIYRMMYRVRIPKWR